MRLQDASLRKGTQVCWSAVCACSEPGEGSSAPPAGEQERRDPPRTRRPAAGTPCTLTSSAALSDRHWEDNALLLSGT